MNEALRIQNPAYVNSQVVASKETKIGKYSVRAGDRMVVNFYQLHYNPAEW